MSVTNQTPYTNATANGATTVFPFDFEARSASDLVIYLNGVLQTSGYTVTGLSVQTGGDVTFSSAPANGVFVEIKRQVVLQRTSQFAEKGDLPASSVNSEYDRLWMAMQDQGLEVDLSVKFPAESNGLNATLPDAADRANKALIFDADGNVTVSADDYEDQAAAAAASALAASNSATAAGASATSAASSAGTATTQAGIATAQAALATVNAGTSLALAGTRTAPHANFSWFTSLWTVTGCKGPGLASVDKDIADVFQTLYGASIGGAVSYVHPAGSDSNAGDLWSRAFLTLSKALRSTNNGTIYLWPGEYALSDFRRTDSYGDHPKKIIAPFGGVIVRVSGDVLSSKTWTLDGDYSGLYACCVSTTNKPIRILRKDLVDAFGNYVPWVLRSGRTELATTANNFGWAYEANASVALTCGTTSGSTTVTCASTKNIAVGMAVSGSGIPGGATITAVAVNASLTISAAATATAAGVAVTASGNLIYARDVLYQSIETNKANLEAVYGDSSGANRLLMYSSISYWENITFYGYHSVLNESGQIAPEVWAKNCRWKYSATHSLLVEGGRAYTQDCWSIYGTGDGANYSTVNSITSRGVEINWRCVGTGDVLTYGTAQTLNPQGNGQNKNASSAHPNAVVVRVNGDSWETYGPNIADTAGSYIWDLGVKTSHNALAVGSAPSTPRYGILNQGNTAWLDGCAASGADSGLNSDSSAVVYTFNTAGTQAATNGGTFTAYLPS